MTRSEILESLRAAHGSATGDHGPRISIRDVRLIHKAPPIATVRYVEIHDWSDGSHTERISTALLEADPDAPDGVLWLHVHETWLPGMAPDRD